MAQELEKNCKFCLYDIENHAVFGGSIMTAKLKCDSCVDKDNFSPVKNFPSALKPIETGGNQAGYAKKSTSL